jgi:hypothetical protein
MYGIKGRPIKQFWNDNEILRKSFKEFALETQISYKRLFL